MPELGMIVPQYNYTVIPPIEPIDQRRQDLCWLASTAEIFSWRERRSMTMDEAASRLGPDFESKSRNGEALTYSEISLWTARANFRSEAQQCIAAFGWDFLLRRHGPLVTLVDGTGSKHIDHAVVVFGIIGDGGGRGTQLKFANSQSAKVESVSLVEFATIFELPPNTDQLFSVSYLK
jgi:hypothetical protein